MASSNVSLWNRALIALGSSAFIQSQTENSAPARAMMEVYWGAVDKMLSTRDFDFAEYNVGPLNPLSGTNPMAGEFAYWFNEPPNILRIREISIDGSVNNRPVWRFRRFNEDVQGPVFACDLASPHVRYTKRVRDPQQFTPGFENALVFLLASLTALKITSHPGIVESMGRAHQRALSEAGVEMNSMDEKTSDAEWISARE